MSEEVVQLARHAVGLKVGRRGTDRHALVGDLARHQIALGFRAQGAGADHEVETFLDHVDAPVVEVDLELQAGRALRQGDQNRRRAAAAEEHRQRQP